MTEISPYPVNGGERIRSYGLLKALSSKGYRVFAIIRNTDGVDLTAYELPGVKYLVCDPSRTRRAIAQPFQLFHQDRETKALIERILFRHKIEAAFLDYYFLGQYIRLFTSRNIRVIYGTHNAQAKLTNQQPAGTIKKKVFKAMKVAAQWLHERTYFRQADVLLTVSNEDREYYMDFVSQEKIFTIPNFLDEGLYTCCYTEDSYLIFTGNFNAFQNFHGLKWFLGEVWNEEISSRCRLILVGKGSKEALRRLAAKSTPHNVEALGMVEDVKPWLAGAMAALVPLQHGSGTRHRFPRAYARGTFKIQAALVQNLPDLASARSF